LKITRVEIDEVTGKGCVLLKKKRKTKTFLPKGQGKIPMEEEVANRQGYIKGGKVERVEMTKSTWGINENIQEAWGRTASAPGRKGEKGESLPARCIKPDAGEK